MLSSCVDTTMKAQAMLITSLGFFLRQNPECQGSKYLHALVMLISSLGFCTHTILCGQKHAYTLELCGHRENIYQRLEFMQCHKNISLSFSSLLLPCSLSLSLCSLWHPKSALSVSDNLKHEARTPYCVVRSTLTLEHCTDPVQTQCMYTYTSCVYIYIYNP